MKSWPIIRPYVMIAPALIVFLLFFIYPIYYMVYLSLHSWDFISPTKDFVGLSNFQQLLNSSEFAKVLSNTLVYTFGTVVFSITLALFLALWLNRSTRIHRLAQTAVFSPYIISLASIALLWLWMMDPDFGLLNWLLSLVGIPKQPWLTDQNTALFSLILVAVWKGVGFNTLVFIAGLQSIPKDLYEAADLDQSPKWRTFYKITLPMLTPTLFFLVVTNVIVSFQVFDTVHIMTLGGPVNSTNTLVFNIYMHGFRFFNIGYASAVGVILLILLAIMTWLYFRLLSKRVHYQ
ncbi:carbohydrate ABC transporter permease [Evansella tamaricis]|uniref:Sugar ABC transporter permease n=1 Tax=Evansella tamaricis TaxID=2069301 RepID=A0ABS6JDL6_9BACI|nr:sugar ABC transporter permease [Evansella tamaricis]MBU9711294.1 sugar ABC transporter permease [Evansella tamaricis]